MEQIASQSSITLVVKTPNQRVRDIEVSCLLDWTVEKLKSHLATVYPTKPTRSSQKIIYSGRLLDDHSLLKDVLQESNGGQQTVHLVCTPSAPDSSPVNTSVCDPPRSQTTVPETASAETTNSSQSDGLRHRSHQGYPQHPFYSMFQPHIPSYPGAVHGNPNTNVGQFVPGQFLMPPNLQHLGQPGSQYAMQHMAHIQWMHHMAHMMQGLPYMSVPPAVPYPHQTVAQPSTPEVNPPEPVPAAQAPPAQAPPAAQAAPERQENGPQNRNIVMNANAGGGMMQEDDEEENIQRDWLDYIYMIVRIFMLMSIFWFYSSAERLVLMAVAMFVIWLFQAGWFSLNRAQRNRQQDLPADNNNGEAGGDDREDEDDEGEGEDEEDGVVETESAPGDTDDQDSENAALDTNNGRQAEHPGYLVVCYNFVTTFFTSLIPQAPQPIAQP